MQPLVIDIYHGDAVQDFARVKAAGIVGVIHKASQGGAVVDRAYASRRKLALAAGLKWGAYHFFDFSAPHLLQVPPLPTQPTTGTCDQRLESHP